MGKGRQRLGRPRRANFGSPAIARCANWERLIPSSGAKADYEGPSWANRVTLSVRRSLPVYPRKRTSTDRPVWSVSCQEQTSYQLFGLDLTAFERAIVGWSENGSLICVAAALPAGLGAVACEIGSQFNFVALPASCWNACLNRVRSFSSSTILRLLGVSPRFDRPAQLAGCASSYPIPRIEAFVPRW